MPGGRFSDGSGPTPLQALALQRRAIRDNESHNAVGGGRDGAPRTDGRFGAGGSDPTSRLPQNVMMQKFINAMGRQAMPRMPRMRGYATGGGEGGMGEGGLAARGYNGPAQPGGPTGTSSGTGPGWNQGSGNGLSSSSSNSPARSDKYVGPSWTSVSGFTSIPPDWTLHPQAVGTIKPPPSTSLVNPDPYRRGPGGYTIAPGATQSGKVQDRVPGAHNPSGPIRRASGGRIPGYAVGGGSGEGGLAARGYNGPAQPGGNASSGTGPGWNQGSGNGLSGNGNGNSTSSGGGPPQSDKYVGPAYRPPTVTSTRGMKTQNLGPAIPGRTEIDPGVGPYGPYGPAGYGGKAVTNNKPGPGGLLGGIAKGGRIPGYATGGGEGGMGEGGLAARGYNGPAQPGGPNSTSGGTGPGWNQGSGNGLGSSSSSNSPARSDKYVGPTLQLGTRHFPALPTNQWVNSWETPDTPVPEWGYGPPGTGRPRGQGSFGDRNWQDASTRGQNTGQGGLGAGGRRLARGGRIPGYATGGGEGGMGEGGLAARGYGGVAQPGGPNGTSSGTGPGWNQNSGNGLSSSNSGRAVSDKYVGPTPAPVAPKPLLPKPVTYVPYKPPTVTSVFGFKPVPPKIQDNIPMTSPWNSDMQPLPRHGAGNVTDMPKNNEGYLGGSTRQGPSPQYPGGTGVGSEIRGYAAGGHMQRIPPHGSAILGDGTSNPEGMERVTAGPGGARVYPIMKPRHDPNVAAYASLLWGSA